METRTHTLNVTQNLKMGCDSRGGTLVANVPTIVTS